MKNFNNSSNNNNKYKIIKIEILMLKTNNLMVIISKS